jgi:sensor domain CHASE-containing protein
MHVSADWAWWDESYSFMSGGNQDYVIANLGDQAFINLKINLLAYIDTENNIVWAKDYDYRNLAKGSIPPDVQAYLTGGTLFYPTADNAGFSGILRSDKYPILFSAQPILKSNMEGPANGFLFMASYLDSQAVSEISE